MERKRWTPQDIAKLQSLAGKYPDAQIAIELGRSLGAIVMKAHQLRISLRAEAKQGSKRDMGATGIDLTS
jgi:hypothetical protein